MNMFAINKKILAALLCASIATGQMQAFGWSSITSLWKSQSTDSKSLIKTIGFSLLSTIVFLIALNTFVSDAQCDESCKGDDAALKKNKENNKKINKLRRIMFKKFVFLATAGILLSPLALNFKTLYAIWLFIIKFDTLYRTLAIGSILYFKSKYPLIVNSINGNINDSESIIKKNKTKVNKKFLVIFSPLDTGLMPAFQRKKNIKLLLDNGAEVKQFHIDNEKNEEIKASLKTKFEEQKQENERKKQDQKETIE